MLRRRADVKDGDLVCVACGKPFPISNFEGCFVAGLGYHCEECMQTLVSTPREQPEPQPRAIQVPSKPEVGQVWELTLTNRTDQEGNPLGKAVGRALCIATMTTPNGCSYTLSHLGFLTEFPPEIPGIKTVYVGKLKMEES